MQQEIDENMNSGNKQQPLLKINSGNISVAMFKNEAGHKSYSLKIGYKDGEEWVDKKISIMEREIDRAIAVLKALRKADLAVQ